MIPAAKRKTPGRKRMKTEDKRKSVPVSMDRELLAKINELVADLGGNRSAYICNLIALNLEQRAQHEQDVGQEASK